MLDVRYHYCCDLLHGCCIHITPTGSPPRQLKLNISTEKILNLLFPLLTSDNSVVVRAQTAAINVQNDMNALQFLNQITYFAEFWWIEEMTFFLRLQNNCEPWTINYNSRVHLRRNYWHSKYFFMGKSKGCGHESSIIKNKLPNFANTFVWRVDR